MTYHHGNLRTILLDRAADVIAEQGIETLSLRALARDIGVSHAAPARHFRDKADLLRALATEGSQRLTTYVFAAADAAGADPLKRYEALGRAYVQFSLEFPAYYKTATHPEVAARADDELRAARRHWHAVVAQAAREAQEAGWLPGEDIEDIVMFSIATVRGVAAMLADPLHDGPQGEAERKRLIERMVRLIVNPAAPQRGANKNTNEARSEP